MCERELSTFIVAPRATGKSTAIAAWLRDGHEVNTYPWWSRVALFTDIKRCLWFRNEFLYNDPALDGLDVARWVYTVDEWQRASVPRRDLVQVAVDDAEGILFRALGVQPDLVAMSGTLAADFDRESQR